MKLATLNYLHKLNKEHSTSYSKFNLFGSGGSDRVFSNSGSFTQYFIDNLNNIVLEYQDVTIDEGVSVTAFNPSLGITNLPFYLKVNGTLTVNGHLHMDNKGALTALDNAGYSTVYSSSSPAYIINNSLNYLEGGSLSVIESRLGQGKSCSFNNYSTLQSYGSTPTFFNLQVAMTGCGHVWYNTGGAYLTQSVSPISASPVATGTDGGYGGGGGFLALYYEDIHNEGPVWEDVQPNSYTYGQIFNTNIHCNGAKGLNNTFIADTTTPCAIAGGGMMVIAARKIVIGPNGSITCDSYFSGDTNPQFGEFALLNRFPMSGYVFNDGTISAEGPTDLVGGGGICLGYKR